ESDHVGRKEGSREQRHSESAHVSAQRSRPVPKTAARDLASMDVGAPVSHFTGTGTLLSPHQTLGSGSPLAVFLEPDRSTRNSCAADRSWDVHQGVAP